MNCLNLYHLHLTDLSMLNDLISCYIICYLCYAIVYHMLAVAQV